MFILSSAAVFLSHITKYTFHFCGVYWGNNIVVVSWSFLILLLYIIEIFSPNSLSIILYSWSPPKYLRPLLLFNELMIMSYCKFMPPKANIRSAFLINSTHVFTFIGIAVSLLNIRTDWSDEPSRFFKFCIKCEVIEMNHVIYFLLRLLINI